MSRKGQLLIIAGIALVAAVVWIFKLQATKQLHPFDSAAGTAQTQGDRRPFRSAVVELTFRSKSLHQGEEYLSETGHGIEYIDAAGGRRRQDFERTVTALRQLTSTEGLTLIFDGTKLYIVTSKDGKRAGRVTDLREGYDYTVWEDAFSEWSKLPGTSIGEEQFLGRQCKLYTLAIRDQIQKWWVWNGVTLRSESHLGTTPNADDTSEEAVRVEEDVEIDSGLFSPPPDVTFEPAELSVADQQNHHKPAPWMRMRPDVMFGIYF
ncbi:MAG: hypothetical protein WBB89_20625 [Candidatus Acidiferrum sp.]